ncbi:MAG: NAD kinase [Bacteroidales bacterium]
MKTALFGKALSPENRVHVQYLIKKLEKEARQLYIYSKYYDIICNCIDFTVPVIVFSSHEEIKSEIDCLISIGGDGTLLDSVPLVRDSGIPILGINVGRLGFLSSVSKDEIDNAVACLRNKTYELDARGLLRLDTKEKLFGELNFALNELTINRKNSNSLIVIHVWINDKLLNSYWADGIIISTPTGSTAYSLSSGGPIITPEAECFVITPIATHNLTVRPFVIPDNCRIQIKIEGRDKEYLVGLDSRSESIDSSVKLEIVKEKFQVNLVRIPGKHFLDTIREKLKWGQDIRN